MIKITKTIVMRKEATKNITLYSLKTTTNTKIILTKTY